MDKIKQIENLIEGLRKDLQHLEESRENIMEDCERQASQYNEPYKSVALANLKEKASKDIESMHLEIMGNIINLKLILEQEKKMKEINDEQV